ncbi:outer membrane protein assembly factor BamA [Xanthomonas sacchari]|uniref:outer membrane protein assembly factor BamA n=1 Tax=Xanthomonas sacchari TaxID=56458 RepID=UPI00224DF73F|nr:outer membrane protein assembly factor BamA [Xanthomonas sacchari]MCW0385846.1 Outer membrane protein assembly factor BamA [Xanthomonas sacchari]MCW0402593.1 Outer membrane protein assembly factor BamA [Xanthomonas sacchari]MCW0415952.1 Outer membrane protein assembly factor BamA [Xanthomonas sacchari]
MTRFPTRRLLALALAASLSLPALAQVAEPFTASDIRVDGLQRISSGTVFTYLPVERGDTVDEAKVAEAIRALYRTGFFEDVRVDRQGNILVVTVKERPAINKLTVTGNKDIKSEELLKGLSDIGLSEGGTFDRLSLDRVTQELTRQYNNRGKYNVEITPTVSPLDRNRVDVAIAIKEGKAAKIRHVNLIGTEKFLNKDILENWESREHNWLSWYRRDDQYSKEKLSGDLEKLNSWYLDRGYVDFSVDSTQVAISPDKRDMYLTAGITEGEQYKISDIKVTGDTILPQEEIEKLVIPKAGDTFSRALLEYSSDAITNTLSNIGYAFAKVTPIPTTDREKRTVAVNLQVTPGPRVSVRRIVFRGNTRTSDEVLRREMRQFEDTWYSQAAIDRSKIRLQRLGYFESVDVETPPVPGSNDKVDVVYNVKETTSGSFTFGLGYSQTYGVTTSVQLSQNNFLGGGNRVAVDASRSSYQERYAFSYTNPFFTDDGVSLGYNLSWRKLDYSDFGTAQYNSTNGAAQVIFGVPITETDSVSLMFGVDSNQITTYPGFTPQAIINYIDAIGTKTFHAWRSELGWARDTRDQYFMPTRGMYQRVGLEATLPGSTVEYWKLNYQISKYWPLSSSLVLNTRAEFGYGDSYGSDVSRDICGTYTSDAQGTTTYNPQACNGSNLIRSVTASGLPFYENFYAGGTNSVRGFEDNTLGPRSEATASYRRGQPLGGSFKTVGSFEMYFPKLFDSPSARISAFVDFGNVFNGVDNFKSNELRASTGIALLWRAPVGPISISYAIPLKKEDNDEIERLQFTFGGQF